MEQQLEILKKRVAFYEYEYDSDAEIFITRVCGSIIDAPSALRAPYLYSGVWFRDLGYSIEKKIEFCRRLIDTVTSYNPSYVSDLWINVVNGVPEAIEAIDVREVRDSIDEV